MAPASRAIRPAAGRTVKTRFTISAALGYGPIMGILAAAIAMAALAPSPTAVRAASADRQAQATVTIVSSAALRFAEIERAHPRALRQSTVRGADGSRLPVRLYEFQ